MTRCDLFVSKRLLILHVGVVNDFDTDFKPVRFWHHQKTCGNKHQVPGLGDTLANDGQPKDSTFVLWEPMSSTRAITVGFTLRSQSLNATISPHLSRYKEITK